MENKSISIQSDEITKGIMSELEDEMTRALSRISRTMTEEVLDKLKPIEKKISDLKNDFEEVQEDNEDFVYKIDDINKNITNIRKSIENSIEEAVFNVIGDQSKAVSESLEKLLSGTQASYERLEKVEENIESRIVASTDSILRNINIKDMEDKIDLTSENLKNQLDSNKNEIIEKSEINKNEIINKIDSIDVKPMEEKMNSLWAGIEAISEQNKNEIIANFENMDMSGLEDKLAILGIKVVKDAARNKDEVLSALESINLDNLDHKMNNMEHYIGNKISENEKAVFEKLDKMHSKIGEKDDLIKLINRVESKVEVLQEEVEWGNKSLFSKIFGKRNY